MADTLPIDALPLLPTMRADPQGRRLALAFVLVTALVFVVLAPFAQVKLAPMQAFIPVYESALLLNDLITSVMLFGHVAILRSKALLVLASAYLFTALMTVPHALTFPGLFAATGILGAGSQSTAWIYVFWHVGFPFCLIAYALIKRGGAGGAVPLERPRLAIAQAIAGVMAAAAVSTAICTVGHDLLPPILVEGHYSIAGHVSLSLTWACSLVALLILWRYTEHSMLDLWLMVVMAAWLCDIALSAVLNAGRFDLGWYAGRIFGLLAASYVLVVLLLESNKLLARLVLAHDHALRRSAQLQDMNVQAELRATQYAAALEALHFKEEQIRAVVQNIADCVLTTDADGQVRSANPAVARVFGQLPEEVVGRSLASLIPALSHVAHADIGDGEVEGRHGDGHAIPLELAMNDFEVHGERQFVVVLRDLSERLQLVAQLRRARSHAEQANKAKSVFLSNMSHELRTPLNAILGFAQILASDSMPVTAEQRREFTAYILKAGKHLLVLINEVLDLAKVESGTLSLSQEAVALWDVIDACQQMIAPLAAQRNIRLMLGHDQGLHVMADRTRLKQILLNLMSNAVKYNRQGGFVSVKTTSVGPERIRITVEDSGLGLDAGQLEQLFQPFNRLGREAGEEEGTGIGLVMTKRLVDMMNGAIGVDSTVGQGSVFWVELGAAAPVQAVAPETVRRSAIPFVAAPAGSRVRTVLYVEDNPANLALVREIVAYRSDLQLLTAIEAEEGIALARARQPDVILMDLNLPGMSGVEALRILRADPDCARIPVIALSANAMSRDVAHSMAAGFFAYITKPLDIDQFFAALDGALAQTDQALP